MTISKAILITIQRETTKQTPQELAFFSKL